MSGTPLLHAEGPALPACPAPPAVSRLEAITLMDMEDLLAPTADLGLGDDFLGLLDGGFSGMTSSDASGSRVRRRRRDQTGEDEEEVCSISDMKLRAVSGDCSRFGAHQCLYAIKVVCAWLSEACGTRLFTG